MSRTQEMQVRFGRGLKVDLEYKGFLIPTDQPVDQGGDNTAPAPFDYFIASIATCAGFYALAFCREREIPVDEIVLKMITEKGPESKMIDRIAITVDLPPSFPARYTFALEKAINLCSVKKHLDRPPKIEVLIRDKA